MFEANSKTPNLSQTKKQKITEKPIDKKNVYNLVAFQS